MLIKLLEPWGTFAPGRVLDFTHPESIGKEGEAWEKTDGVIASEDLTDFSETETGDEPETETASVDLVEKYKKGVEIYHDDLLELARSLGIGAAPNWGEDTLKAKIDEKLAGDD